ncbi:histidine kinase [Pseudomonas sp. NPDC089392]|uniref:histidine kinase n=1 Tax=Pseudomonas sp. NPDC089392 TaxID=3364459 RepID=UPI0038040FDE
MHQTSVLIHQARPSHQILLHQALNAQGVFDVRISANCTDLDACLGAERRPDLLILDHAMPTRAGLALLARQHRARALLFVGQPTPKRHDLAQEARNKGLWVLAELPWPLSMPRLQHALQTLQLRPWRRIQTVMSATHAQ